MRFSVAQLNYHIGNFESNKGKIVNAIKKAKDQKSDLIIFSELCIPGYPPYDLLDRYDFVEKCIRTVDEVSRECTGITAIVGSPVINKNPEGKKLFNSALVLSEGKIIFSTNKALLPTYDIFDEYRYFQPDRNFKVFPFKGFRIAITICEDIWDEQHFDNEFERKRLYTISPMDELAKQYPDFIINISASPFSYSRIDAKTSVFTNKAAKHGIPLISSNQTGANTELIFDGASMIINGKGEICHRFPFFEEEVMTFTYEEIFSPAYNKTEKINNHVGLIHKALITGIRDYFTKTGIKKGRTGPFGRDRFGAGTVPGSGSSWK